MNIPDAELHILKTLWRDGPCTIADLAGRIYPDGGVSAHATVQKLLERLMARACVDRTKQGRRHLYFALIDRDSLIESQLKQTADTLCEGSWTPLLTQLLDSSRLDAADRREVRDLLRHLEARLADPEQMEEEG